MSDSDQFAQLSVERDIIWAHLNIVKDIAQSIERLKLTETPFEAKGLTLPDPSAQAEGIPDCDSEDTGDVEVTPPGTPVSYVVHSQLNEVS